MKYWNQDLFTNAWNFASKVHNGQKEPTSNLPYINHIGKVTMEVMTAIIQSNGITDPDLAIQCALLHDVIEDTRVGYKELKHKFGLEVADGVLALTKNKNLPSKEEQMHDSLTRILTLPKEIRMIKMADRISNLQQPPPKWKPERIEGYYHEALQIHKALHTSDYFLSERLLNKIKSYKQYFL